MSQNRRMRICSSCDGFVDLDVIVCPYCGNDMISNQSVETEKKDLSEYGNKKRLSVEETLSSLYPPPYKPKNFQTIEPDNFEANDFYKEEKFGESKRFDDTDDLKKDSLAKEESGDREESIKKSKLNISKLLSNGLPVLLFSFGINVLLLGIYLFVFSTNGEVFIRWNATYWYLYVILGVPFAIFGYKMVDKSS